ncbi:hypothetical protein [Streptacidiphilus rugosus]|uniref:hypothetical protein n=1 Tax=Streptacidiphilus rugosus TaxID=405783 RepID=UPI0006902F25|nr:hypothetical protein [Streptacidiphilus rugosus]
MKTSQILGLSAALASVGLMLLSVGPGTTPHARNTAATAPVPRKSAPGSAGTPSPASPTSTAGATATGTPAIAVTGTAVLPSNALAPDDGPAGDHLIQAMLDAHSPHNLPKTLEQRLDQLGRAVWLADLTGEGRAQWPRYFAAPGASGFSDIRIQAAAARGTGPGRVSVTLLWAGTSPAGDPEVGLPATVQLAQQDDGGWEPVR